MHVDGFDIEQGTAVPMTWSKGSAFVVTWIPIWDHDELLGVDDLDYCRCAARERLEELQLGALGDAGPALARARPGLAQVSTPPTLIVQP